MLNKDPALTSHRWKPYRHDSMGEINGVRCEVQTWKCEFCRKEVDLISDEKPINEECPAKATPLKKIWVAPMKNKNAEANQIKQSSLNLRALIYSPRHSSYCEVVSISNIDDLEIDHRNKTWSCNVPGFNHGNKIPLPIGQCDLSTKDACNRVIGIYDITNDKQLSALANNWHDIQELKHAKWDDEE